MYTYDTDDIIFYLRGGSYGATVHLCYLETNPSDVKAASLDIQTDRVYYKNYRNGCCYDFCNAKWWAYMLKNRYPKHLSDTKSIVYADILKRPYEKIMERLVGEDVPEYTDMLLNETYNDFWINGENTYAADNLKIPTLFGEGWYDFYVDGMFSMWERLPEETRKKSAFLVGPWGHGTCRTDATEHPLPNSQIPVDYIIAFFNSIRDNTPYTQFELGKTNYYSIGGGRWTTQTEEKGKFKLYFNGNNTMSAKPTCTGEMHYIYDPEKPLGYYKRLNIFKQGEPVDGVVSFTSAPFEEDISFFGKIAWHMKVRSSCDDTAFFMRVYMVEDGESYNLTDTITSLSYLNENYAAGEACLVDIVTPQIGFTIKKGNAIRVDISSHSDIYVPHANVKGHWAKATETKVATNTLICDEDAYIELAVCLD